MRNIELRTTWYMPVLAAGLVLAVAGTYIGSRPLTHIGTGAVFLGLGEWSHYRKVDTFHREGIREHTVRQRRIGGVVLQVMGGLLMVIGLIQLLYFYPKP